MKNRGFTLLELIIVLALVVLILGLTSLFVAGRLPSAKANAAGREIAGMIRHARSLAFRRARQRCQAPPQTRETRRSAKRRCDMSSGV